MKQKLHLLAADKVALASAIYLAAVVLIGIVGPFFIDPSMLRSNLRARHLAPFQLDQSWVYFLGADALGRSILVRLVQATATTLTIAFATVGLSLLIGGAIGLMAGLRDSWLSAATMRAIDVLMSIPSLLLAMVVLYAIGAHPLVVILVLTATRIPVFARTARGQTLEIRGQAFISASTVMGARSRHLLIRHITPMVMPTLLAVAALEFAVVMLAESTLTFLGIGVQPPDVTWGLMVADGRQYLGSAWWDSFWPGLAIATIALAATILGNWYQVANDPTLRSRIAGRTGQHA